MSIWTSSSWEGHAIIAVLILFSIFAWSTMAYKAKQMRRARKLNHLFLLEFRDQDLVLDIHNRDIEVEGCPLYSVYRAGCADIESRLNARNGGNDSGNETTATSPAHNPMSTTWIEHIKRTLERTVAEQSLRLESGLILLAIAVSGAPFLGLLGTVLGVMRVFSDVAISGQANLPVMAPGLSAAMMTTVAGLLVAIPSMFGYNWLVHHLRVLTVELDNFAQELMSNVETEYLMEPVSEPTRN